MTGHRKFSELEERMSPERLARSNKRVKSIVTAMLLSEMRRHANYTQNELADKLGIRQPSLSKLESQSDMHIGTLKRIVEALGGELELIAHLPSGDVRLTQFG